MKFRLLVISLLFSSAIYSQDTTFYKQDDKTVDVLKVAHHYVVKTKDTIDTNKVVTRKYIASGQILEENFFSNYSKHIRHGSHKQWFEDGSVKIEANYKNGKENGPLLSYWENGQAKRNDFYKKGRLKEGECWDKNGIPINHYDFEIMPEFPGGMRKFYEYLNANLGYPIKSYEARVEGKVLVKFVVERNGSITNAEVLKGINQELDWEALRVVKFMPHWTPGQIDGETARVQFRVSISFSIHH